MIGAQLIHFIGGGNMATAMILGLEALPTPPRLVICDRSEDARDRHGARGCSTVAAITDLTDVEVAVLAFKPQHFAGAVDDLRESLAPNALVLSILVGVSTRTIEAALPGIRVVRVMPNTPMMVGEGMSGVAPGSRASASDVDVAVELASASGRVIRVGESQIDDVAAISGSGPAYFFRFCEVLVDVAMKECGFSEETARVLVGQTARGALTYLESQEGFPAARLRKEVTSPGGTTEAALSVLAERGFAEMMAEAIQRAKARAVELNEAAR